MNVIAMQILSQTRGSVHLGMDRIHRVVTSLNHKFIQINSAVMFWVLTQQCSLVLWSVCTLQLKTFDQICGLRPD